jgi:hypothetical protein
MLSFFNLNTLKATFPIRKATFFYFISQSSQYQQFGFGLLQKFMTGGSWIS